MPKLVDTDEMYSFLENEPESICRLDKTSHSLPDHALTSHPSHSEAWSVREVVGQGVGCMALGRGSSEHVTN